MTLSQSSPYCCEQLSLSSQPEFSRPPSLRRRPITAIVLFVFWHAPMLTVMFGLTRGLEDLRVWRQVHAALGSRTDWHNEVKSESVKRAVLWKPEPNGLPVGRIVGRRDLGVGTECDSSSGRLARSGADSGGEEGFSCLFKAGTCGTCGMPPPDRYLSYLNQCGTDNYPHESHYFLSLVKCLWCFKVLNLVRLPSGTSDTVY